MPKLTIEGAGTFDVKEGTKLVLAIEDNGVHILIVAVEKRVAQLVE